MPQRVFFFDLLRAIAAVAVIAIHVLAPYRDRLGEIPFVEWLIAVTVNGASRWAVPVFIMISGALMLSDRRPFELRYYLERRLGKVLIPFLVWSLFYAFLSGWSPTGFDGAMIWQTLLSSPQHETYYHLGFFYYFIPLYFVIPFLQWGAQRWDSAALYAFVAVWLLTTMLYLLRLDGPWSHDLWLFSGYLPLGYLLYQKCSLKRGSVLVITLMGLVSLYITVQAVVTLSLVEHAYRVGRWFSYKTINVVLMASMVFILARAFASKLPLSWQQGVSFVSRYSLGIYLLHPIFLWPMKAYGWWQGHPAWVIPLWVLLSGVGSLWVSWLVSRSPKTRWLLP
ncbi:acyltransferase [Vibrio sp. AH4]|uniref:acyltransferase n=1 Tax=Vibrio sp. AH4 TaxID=2919577 RepID=UPI00273A319D|nr:acyltransferase family protein [Vibrio sp. AH4]MDP4491576.1 acyltransferase family protein [Vibrio sp. AH4]